MLVEVLATAMSQCGLGGGLIAGKYFGQLFKRFGRDLANFQGLRGTFFKLIDIKIDVGCECEEEYRLKSNGGSLTLPQ